jgi:hypothetical protein
MYHVTSIAVLHNESIGCFLDMAYKFYDDDYYYYHRHHPGNSVVTKENHTLFRPSFVPRTSRIQTLNSLYTEFSLSLFL